MKWFAINFNIFIKPHLKHLCQCLFFNKVAGLRPVALLKKRHWHRCFDVNFAKFLRKPFLTEHLRWLLLATEVYFSLSYKALKQTKDKKKKSKIKMKVRSNELIL